MFGKAQTFICSGNSYSAPSGSLLIGTHNPATARTHGCWTAIKRCNL